MGSKNLTNDLISGPFGRYIRLRHKSEAVGFCHDVNGGGESYAKLGCLVTCLILNCMITYL